MGSNPLREMLSLRDAMDRMFEDSFLRPWTGQFPQGGRSWFPVDVADEDNHFVVRAELPGVKPEDVQVTVHGDTLTIRADTKDEQEQQRQNWVVRERRSGTFQRMVTLPSSINAEGATARFEDGTLTLTLPKTEEAKPRQIPVGRQGDQTGTQNMGQTSQNSGQMPQNSGSMAQASGGTNQQSRGDEDRTQSGSQAQGETQGDMEHRRAA
jgi:HSP20 family protein